MIDTILNTPSKGKPKNNPSSNFCSEISFYLTTIITIRVQQSRTIGIHERNRTTTQVIPNNNNIDNGHKKNHGPSIILFPMVLASSLGGPLQSQGITSSTVHQHRGEHYGTHCSCAIYSLCLAPTLFVPLSVPLKRRITMPFRYTALPGSLISVQLYLRREAKDRTSRRRSEEDVHSNDDRSVESLS